MPDIAQVLGALALRLADTLYPNGLAAPSAVGAPCVLFVGWPDQASLEADLRAGKIQISVVARSGMAKTEQRRLDGWRPAPRTRPTMTATVSGNTVTFAGTGMPGQVAAVVVAEDGWSVMADATPALTAAALAAEIGDLASADGPVLTLPAGLGLLKARVVAARAETISLRRQVQGVQITVWANTPAKRDAVVALLDTAMELLIWLPVEGGDARVRYAGTVTTDEARQAGLFRRDLMLDLDYPTTAKRTSPVTALPAVTLRDPDAPAPGIRTTLRA